jgi:hypothetical protein
MVDWVIKLIEVSTPPPAGKAASLIEKETLKKRIPACHASCVG